MELGDTALNLSYAVSKSWVLGFNNNLTRNTIKKLSKFSMECSFCIWLARNNKEWDPSAANCKLNDSPKETCNSSSSMPSI